MSNSPLDILCKVAADAESEPLPPIAPPQPPPPPRLPPISNHFRLSSSAPTNNGFLSSHTLPIEPSLNYNYYKSDNLPRYPHTVLPLPRNLSAPSLSDRVPAPELPRPVLDESYRIRTPSQNIPVPRRVTNVISQGLSPPLYGSPPTISRVRSTSYSPLKSVSGRSKTGRRDSYTRFTAEEEAMLMDGVRIYGVGNWKKILNSYRFHWKRTAVDLKDKYRNMTRAKMRRMNASSQSDLSSVGSDDGRGVQAMSPLQNELLSKTIGLRISPVSTGNNTPAGSVDDKVVRR